MDNCISFCFHFELTFSIHFCHEFLELFLRCLSGLIEDVYQFLVELLGVRQVKRCWTRGLGVLLWDCI